MDGANHRYSKWTVPTTAIPNTGLSREYWRVPTESTLNGANRQTHPSFGHRTLGGWAVVRIADFKRVGVASAFIARRMDQALARARFTFRMSVGSSESEVEIAVNGWRRDSFS